MKHAPQPSPRGGGPKVRSDKQLVADPEYVALLKEVADYCAREWRLVCAQIRRQGRVQTSSTGRKVDNPLVGQRRQLEQSLFQYAGEWNKYANALPGDAEVEEPDFLKVVAELHRVKGG